jgi:formate hydrogenlyase subunit 4
MGASREALFSLFAEPAFFILMGSFALLTGYSSFQGIFIHMHFGSKISYALGALATFVLVIIAMVENSRMPFDDPKTHLELTMVHEVMILDNSGFDLGMILFTTNLKFAMYGALIANFFIGAIPWYFALLVFFGVQILFAITVGLLESFSARFRMSHNAQYIYSLSSVALLIFFGVLLVLKKFL